MVYVDDLLIGFKSLKEIARVKNLLTRKFNMVDPGKVKDILSIHVERDKETGSHKLSQRHYIENLLKTFNMENCKSLSTPLEAYIKLEKANNYTSNQKMLEPNANLYRELIGRSLYLANATRPDITFAVSLLSRFCDNPSITHWKNAKNVLRYLRGTMDYAIAYRETNTESEEIGRAHV